MEGFKPSVFRMWKLRYSREAKDFGHKQNAMRQNFIKTESLRLRKTSLNTVNSVYCSTTLLPGHGQNY